MTNAGRSWVWGAALLMGAGTGAAVAMPADTASLSFTQAQVVQGRAAYGKWCAACHGGNLEGGAGVGLAGAPFARSWADGHHNLGDFYDVVAKQMPKSAPGSLSEDDDLAIVAFILNRNGYPASKDRLSTTRLDATLAPPPTGIAGATSAASFVARFTKLPKTVW